jgi:arylsulfatase A-like enzyme
MWNRKSSMSRLLCCGFVCLGVLVRARADPPAPADNPAPPDTRPNVIMITISSLRADHVSCLGYHRPTTPHFDRLAQRNTLFRNAFATSGWMMPAHGSLFTSLYPSVHGATHIDRRLDDAHDTLAERLAANGYYCVGFCCAPRLDAEHGFAQGFHVYDDRGVAGLLQTLDPGGTEGFDINRRRTNDLINDAAISWLQSNRHSPFFLFVHYYDNHWDYLPPEPYRSLYDPDYAGSISGIAIPREPLYSNPPGARDIQHMVALYDGEVRQTDEDLGQMLTVLENGGWLRNSILLVMGDHGEEFYEHGHTSHQGLYDELIHIPLVISVPRPGPKSTDALVSQVDILPTIFDYAGLPIPGACRGRSLKPLLEGGTRSLHDYVFCEYTGGAIPDVFAIRSLQYKCYLNHLGESFAYDVAADPAETTRIAERDFPPLLRRLQEDLSRIVQGNRPGNQELQSDAESQKE